MKFKNTSKFDTGEMKRLMKIATKGIGLADTAIRVKNSGKGYAGRAYCIAPFEHRSKYFRLIVVRLGDNQYPFKVSYRWKYKTAPEFEAQDWKELFVLIMAHEARHIQQYKKRWPASEIDAEKYAEKRLADYRKEEAAGIRQLLKIA